MKINNYKSKIGDLVVISGKSSFNEKFHAIWFILSDNKIKCFTNKCILTYTIYSDFHTTDSITYTIIKKNNL